MRIREKHAYKAFITRAGPKEFLVHVMVITHKCHCWVFRGEKPNRQGHSEEEAALAVPHRAFSICFLRQDT